MLTHHPFTINIGPLPLTGFGLAVLLGFLISNIIAERELERRGHTTYARAIPDLIIASIVGTIIGGKLYYAGLVTHDWRDLLGRAGFVFWGGFFGAVAMNWIIARRKKLSFIRIADVAGICIAAGYSIGRTGCWAVGDDYGRPWTGPLAVMFPEGSPPSTAAVMARTFGIPIPPNVAPDTILAVHPTQLYESALGFIMFVLLWRWRDHRHAEGWLFGVWLVMAGIERFCIEFLRAKDDANRFGPFTIAQGIALTLALTGVIVMTMRNKVTPERPGIYA